MASIFFPRFFCYLVSFRGIILLTFSFSFTSITTLMASFFLGFLSELCAYRKSFPCNNNGLVYTFETVMAKIAAESQDVKKLEKMFKKQLNEIEVDKEFLENRLKNKVSELKQLHMQYRNKEVFCIWINISANLTYLISNCASFYICNLNFWIYSFFQGTLY